MCPIDLSSADPRRVGYILKRCNCSVRFGSAIAEELPDVADVADHVEVHVGDDDVILITLFRLCDELPARVDEVALAVELADAPRFFPTRPIDRADEVLVGNRVGRLFELPQVFAETSNGGRGVEYDFGAVEAEAASAIGEVAIVANVNADLANFRVEDWVT